MIVELREIEQCALEELKELQTEEEALLKEHEELDRSLAELSAQEDALWLDELADYQLNLCDLEDERGKFSAMVRYAKTQLDRLKRTSVLNDVFHISCDGPFGCINGFRYTYALARCNGLIIRFHFCASQIDNDSGENSITSVADAERASSCVSCH